MRPPLDSLDAVAGELCSATGLDADVLRVALRAFKHGEIGGGGESAALLSKAAAMSRLCEAFGFRGAVRFPADGPDCWFLGEEETVALKITATADLADPERLGEAPVPAPLPGLDRVGGAQAGIVQAFIKAQGRGDASMKGHWLVIYTRLGGFSDKLWDLLRTRFAGDDQIAPFARAFVVDIGETIRGFELA